MHGFGGGFEYAAREARRELMEEARNRRLVRLARPAPGLRGRFARMVRLLTGAREAGRPRPVEAVEPVAVGGMPDSVYLERGPAERPGTAVEVYPGRGGRVVRRTDLRTGASTESSVAEGWVRR